MTGSANDEAATKSHTFGTTRRRPRRNRRRGLINAAFATTLVMCLLVWVAWLGFAALKVKSELEAATALIPSLKIELAAADQAQVAATLEEMRAHTAEAKEEAGHPLWSLASAVPGVGPNLSAVAETARSADDVVNLGLNPLVQAFGSLNWDTVLPSASGTDLGPLSAASPSVSSAAYAVRASADRLNAIDVSNLLPQVAEPLRAGRDQLQGVTAALDTAADASKILPAMLGAESSRSYLLIVQNNAEVRSSGGIPGALAVLHVDNGKLTLGAQTSATDVGVMSPPIPVDAETQQIYSARSGKFMQDVNLTPNFPTAAATAQAMWEKKTGQQVSGVVSIDPVALGYILAATGPVSISAPELQHVVASGLPTELSADNVVQTLLSDVYAKIEQPKLQDAYFAGVAQEIFAALSNGKSDSKRLISGFTRATTEGRVLLWSGFSEEQSLIAKYPLGGSISGPSVLPAQFGVYFNDGTGAKMDYYVRRTVQLVRECPRDGYEETTVRITSTNTAPLDAASSLPAYVTGDGIFGVPPGSVQTNIVAYGPVQAQVESAKLDGQKTGFAPHIHGNRPVGILAVRLAPGESRTVDFTFGKIVQHTEPSLVVTPTVQDVKDVTLPTEFKTCG